MLQPTLQAKTDTNIFSSSQQVLDDAFDYSTAGHLLFGSDVIGQSWFNLVALHLSSLGLPCRCIRTPSLAPSYPPVEADCARDV